MDVKLYKTKDLPESAFLFASEVKLESIDRNGKTCWFTFLDKDLCLRLTHAFWTADAPISAKKYFFALQTLKNRIFATERTVDVYENGKST